jgi:hypothetical protein
MLIAVFRDRPILAADLLAGQLGVTVPTFQNARTAPSDLNNNEPTEYRADLVINLTDGDDVVLAVIVEAQLRPDRRKHRSWPAYVATLYAQLGCPVVLLVVTAKPWVAARCAVPIQVGLPDFVLTPLVLGPKQVPVVTDPELARQNPEMTVLSAMAHGHRGPEQTAVFEAFLAALNALDQGAAKRYADVVLKVLPAAARDHLETLMTTKSHPYVSDFARRYYDQGEAKGEAKGEATAVLAVLDARGIEVSDEVRERVSGCADLGQLETWIRRAATANRADDLFT